MNTKLITDEIIQSQWEYLYIVSASTILDFILTVRDLNSIKDFSIPDYAKPYVGISYGNEEDLDYSRISLVCGHYTANRLLGVKILAYMFLHFDCIECDEEDIDGVNDMFLDDSEKLADLCRTRYKHFFDRFVETLRHDNIVRKEDIIKFFEESGGFDA